MEQKKTAAYKIITESGKKRFRFYCDLSGANACTSSPAEEDSDEKALEAAWEKEGRRQFNQCHKCGRWVIDAMFNADVLECVQCAPVMDKFRFSQLEHFGFGPNVMKSSRVCSNCGFLAKSSASFCPECGGGLPETLFDLYKRQHESCPQCDTVLAPGSRYCPECGLRIGCGENRDGCIL